MSAAVVDPVDHCRLKTLEMELSKTSDVAEVREDTDSLLISTLTFTMCVLRSLVGTVYDVLGYIHPLMSGSHSGMMFSAPWHNHDLHPTYDCSSQLGGGFWFSDCSVWSPNAATPVWFSKADSTFKSMEAVRMMVKLQ